MIGFVYVLSVAYNQLELMYNMKIHNFRNACFRSKIYLASVYFKYLWVL